MPIYQFECKTCKAETEVIQSWATLPPMCPGGCGKTMDRKLVNTSPPVFKCGGFYSTDYGGKKPK